MLMLDKLRLIIQRAHMAGQHCADGHDPSSHSALQYWRKIFKQDDSVETPEGFIKTKIKKWKDNRFGNEGQLVIYQAELEEWLEEYSNQRLGNSVAECKTCNDTGWFKRNSSDPYYLKCDCYK